MFKKEVPTQDFTLLKKRGLLKDNNPKKSQSLSLKGGFLDLTRSQKSQELQAQPPRSQPASPFTLLDALATANTPSIQTSSQEIPTQTDARELANVKVKLDDLEYKLSDLVDRLIIIETKLQKIQIS